MADGLLDDLRRYAALIESALGRAGCQFRPEAESALGIQVERGTAYAAAVLGGERPITAIDVLLEAGDRPDVEHLGSLVVVDRLGHRRPHYRGLLIYSALQAFRLRYEMIAAADFGRFEEGLRPWADMLEAQLMQLELRTGEDGALAAAQGALAADGAWMALALEVAGRIYIRDAWTDLASDFFGKLARAQRPGGACFEPSAGDHPEADWYHELVVLHAIASYAVQTENRPLAAAVARSTAFHQERTQADHATHQPWGLFAFIWNPPMQPMADGMLHAAALAGTPSGLTSILLADALYCLRLFLKPAAP